MEPTEETKQESHELLCRSGTSLLAVRGLPRQEQIAYASPCTMALYSPSGSKLACATEDQGLSVLNAQTHTVIMTTPNTGIQLLHFSQCERYLVTWEKQVENNPNLFVWNLASGQAIYSFSQKKSLKELWPTVVFTPNTDYFLRRNNQELQLYQIPEPQPIAVLSETRVAHFSVSPANPTRVVVYTNEQRGETASVSLFSLSGTAFRKINQTPITKVQDTTFHWNKPGNKVIAWCQTDVDSTGRSYYGEHSLFIIYPDREARSVSTTEGPIHDVKWSPATDEFIVISGFMPATSTLFKGTGGKVKELAKHHRNTIRWNSFGSLFLIAGFGNLQGDIEVYERNTLTVVGTCRAATTVYCEWAPCGRMFVAATLCPRMRVDNGYSIYKYTGELLITVNAQNDLYDVQWRNSPGIFIDRPLTPRKREAAPEKKVYKPPGSSSNFAERFKAVKDSLGHTAPVNIGKSQSQPAFVHQKPQPVVEELVPGQAPEAAKKKKKKKKKKGPETAPNLPK
mmetsp:Transcript_4052/g.3883  ORF Transcript_4052/g.3883 Transcript_4052/m.3883 type:complete len:510 (-) Transcript_4052:38-1567(-)